MLLVLLILALFQVLIHASPFPNNAPRSTDAGPLANMKWELNLPGLQPVQITAEDVEKYNLTAARAEEYMQEWRVNFASLDEEVSTNVELTKCKADDERGGLVSDIVVSGFPFPPKFAHKSSSRIPITKCFLQHAVNLSREPGGIWAGVNGWCRHEMQCICTFAWPLLLPRETYYGETRS